MPVWKKQAATSTPRTLTGNGGTAEDFRRGARVVVQVSEALVIFAEADQAGR